MNRKQALSMYLLGTFGQVLGVSLLVCFLRAGGVKVDFTSSFGIFAIIVGGLSSVFWGSLASISYYQSSFKQVLKDFFKSKTVWQIIAWCSFSCCLTFSHLS